MSGDIVKTEIQNLRTQKNLLRKCVNSVLYELTHIKKEPYDYGEASEEAIEKVLEIVRNCLNKIE